MFNVNNRIVPEIICQMFNVNKSVHSHNTRSCIKYHYPKVSSQSLLNSFRHNGPRIWNNLGNSITLCTTLSSFKVLLKRQLVSSYST